jgi:ketosteroid isomerase-like protein
MRISPVLTAAVAAVILIPAAQSQAETPQHGDPAKIVAALDVEFQAATKANDADTIDRVVADDFVIVTGKGKTFTKADLIDDAVNHTCAYEQQDEVPGSQSVRVFGRKTAVVTALLWIKGTCTDGSKPDYRLWFSDTYVLRDGRWSYAFAQSAQPLG